MEQKNREKHNMANTRLYRAWCNMKGRCYRKSMKRYKIYGGRGIKVCDEWKNSFISFMNWALENGYRDDLTLDRIDVNGNYEPSNCRWISNLEQQSNRRNNRLITFNGETKTLTQWAKKINIAQKTLQGRLDRGWNIEKALTTPKIEFNELTTKNNSRSKKVIQKDKENNIIRIWDSISEIERQKGYSMCSIINVCKHKPKYDYAYGYKWEYYDKV